MSGVLLNYALLYSDNEQTKNRHTKITYMKLSHKRDISLNGEITYTHENGAVITERLNVRTYKQEHKQKGQNSKSSTIVRVEAKRDKLEHSFFVVAHNSRKEERSEAQRNERRAKRK
jgi:hypothetical protein